MKGGEETTKTDETLDGEEDLKPSNEGRKHVDVNWAAAISYINQPTNQRIIINLYFFQNIFKFNWIEFNFTYLMLVCVRERDNVFADWKTNGEDNKTLNA